MKFSIIAKPMIQWRAQIWQPILMGINPCKFGKKQTTTHKVSIFFSFFFKISFHTREVATVWKVCEFWSVFYCKKNVTCKKRNYF